MKTMLNPGLLLVPLLVQLSIKVQAIPPDSRVHAGEVFTVTLAVSQEEPGPWPGKIRPVFPPPEGWELLGISARSGSPPFPGSSGKSLQYEVKASAGEAGKYDLEGIGVYYGDAVSGQEQEAQADPISIEILPSGIFGIAYKWIGLLVLLLGLGIGFSVWLLTGGEKAKETPAPEPRDGEWFRQSLEEIRRFRIRGEEVMALEKISELERGFPEPDPGYIRDLEEKINHLKYGGQKISPAELEEIYRRTELKIKSRYPQEEVKGEG
ncbi:MAG: hypothetical protein NT009_12000 [Proteobacteria bacterium]|nr:hypothetical protein [Pseudomonadota bacterium]